MLHYWPWGNNNAIAEILRVIQRVTKKHIVQSADSTTTWVNLENMLSVSSLTLKATCGVVPFIYGEQINPYR
jgi:hypothetical protein